MIERAWKIAVAHGPLALARRGSSWLGRRIAAGWGSIRRRNAVARSFRLPRRIEPVHVPAPGGEPLVSIVIPCYNAWRYTNACLRALAAAWDPDIPAEVIVVDDGSNDETATLLTASSGIIVINRGENGGFCAAANAGAAAARGRFLHFLNNDALVTPGWLRPLVETLSHAQSAGAVVSQLRNADGRVAEAGGVIWRDGRGSNYGRGGDPSDWRYRSVRAVDYGSAASLCVARRTFETVGGFSPEFVPAYYEDADLCFALRQRGYRVLYQPQSVVVHAEGASYGSNRLPQAKALQERNRLRFAHRWAPQLEGHLPPDPRTIDAAARRLEGAAIALVADEHVPFADRDAGSQRIRYVMETLHALGYHVIFAALDPDEYGAHGAALRACGIDVITGFEARCVARLAWWRLPVELCWLSRPRPATRLMPALRRAFPGAKVIFDTVDLHHVRLEREERATGRRTGWQRMKKRELALARAADVTVVTSSAERAMLEREGVRPAVVSVAQPAAGRALPDWPQRDGIIFVGNYGHAPNVDAALLLSREILPIIRQSVPGVRLTLAGADPVRSLRALAGENVRVPGYVDDLDALLLTNRVFVAPLRFGAGIKAKIVRALAAGLPVVTTPVGAEGIFEESDCGAVATTPAEIARAVVRLYEDRAAWNAAAQGGHVAAARFSPEVATAAITAIASPRVTEPLGS